jgi:hypothetical protein
MLNEDKSVRVVTTHEDLGEDTYHEWFLTHEKVRANSLGVISPRAIFALWTKFRCNNPDCAGWGLAQADLMLQNEIEKSFD